MNKVSLVGRLTRDPEVRYSQGENSTAVARFTVAVDRKFKKDGEATADFISCVSFGKTAEFIEKYFFKGSRIGLSGRIQTGSYEKDGKKIYTTDVLVEEVEFVDSAKSSGETTQNSPAPTDDGFMDCGDGIEEELPFN